MSSSPNPLSTPLSANDESVPQGFGWEFAHCLEQKWNDDLERQSGRLERYSRFGMDADDARQPTPEDLQEAYRLFVKEDLADVHTPSPSPSSKPTSFPESSAHLPFSKLPRIKVTRQTAYRSGKHGDFVNGSDPTAASNRTLGASPDPTSSQSVSSASKIISASTIFRKRDIVAHGNGKQKNHGKIAPTLAPARINKRQRRKVVRPVQHRPSTHRMETRSRTLAVRRGWAQHDAVWILFLHSIAAAAERDRNSHTSRCQSDSWTFHHGLWEQALSFISDRLRRLEKLWIDVHTGGCDGILNLNGPGYFLKCLTFCEEIFLGTSVTLVSDQLYIQRWSVTEEVTPVQEICLRPHNSPCKNRIQQTTAPKSFHPKQRRRNWNSCLKRVKIGHLSKEIGPGVQDRCSSNWSMRKQEWSRRSRNGPEQIQNWSLKALKLPPLYGRMCN